MEKKNGIATEIAKKEGVVKDLMEKYEEHFLKTLKKNTINKINTNLKRSRIKTASIFIT